MAPTIHRNGSDREVLLKQNSEARAALRKTLDALAAMAPNARDYYPQGPAAFPQAQREHEARMKQVRDMAADLMAQAIAIREAP